MAAPINDHKDPLYEFVCDVHLPTPDLPPKWTAETYQQRVLTVRQLYRSAMAEDFPTGDNPQSHVHNKAEPPDVEIRMNILLFVFVKGDCVTDEDLLACREDATNSIDALRKIRDSQVGKIASLSGTYLEQMVVGKIAVEDTFAKLERAERKVKELGIPVLTETAAERTNRLAARDRVRTAVARNIARLLTHFNGYRQDIGHGTVPAAYSGAFGIAGWQNQYLKGRATARVTAWINRLRNRPAWYALDIERTAELPPKRYCYSYMTMAQKRAFWYKFLDEVVYEIFHHLKGFVNLRATFTGEGREHWMFATANLCDDAYSEVLAANQAEARIRVAAQTLTGFAGYDIRMGFTKKQSTTTHTNSRKRMSYLWENSADPSPAPMTYDRVTVLRGVRGNAKPFTPSAYLLPTAPMPGLVAYFAGLRVRVEVMGMG